MRSLVAEMSEQRYDPKPAFLRQHNSAAFARGRRRYRDYSVAAKIIRIAFEKPRRVREFYIHLLLTRRRRISFFSAIARFAIRARLRR